MALCSTSPDDGRTPPRARRCFFARLAHAAKHAYRGTLAHVDYDELLADYAPPRWHWCDTPAQRPSTHALQAPYARLEARARHRWWMVPDFATHGSGGGGGSPRAAAVVPAERGGSPGAHSALLGAASSKPLPALTWRQFALVVFLGCAATFHCTWCAHQPNRALRPTHAARNEAAGTRAQATAPLCAVPARRVVA